MILLFWRVARSSLALVEECQLPWTGFLSEHWTSMSVTSRGVPPVRRYYDCDRHNT
jgi:hypothetical protein